MSPVHGSPLLIPEINVCTTRACKRIILPVTTEINKKEGEKISYFEVIYIPLVVIV
jgi:hypothetical protein